MTRQSAARQSGRRTGAKPARSSWSIPVAIVGVTTFVVLLASLFITTLNSPQPSAASGTEAQPVTGGDPQAQQAQLMNSFEDQITEARMVAQQVPDNVNAWINLGNLLYDSVQIVREQIPESELYQERLPRWIDASEAYRAALELEPDNVVVRADLAASLCKYGEGANDVAYVEEGLAEAQRAVAQDAANPRALLNLGVCLANTDPPQTEAALEQWYAVLDLPTAGQGELFEAQQLIEQYGADAANS
jgi:cytochrome c-type biogenesis protein CcmH/NrfG